MFLFFIHIIDNTVFGRSSHNGGYGNFEHQLIEIDDRIKLILMRMDLHSCINTLLRFKVIYIMYVWLYVDYQMFSLLTFTFIRFLYLTHRYKYYKH